LFVRNQNKVGWKRKKSKKNSKREYEATQTEGVYMETGDENIRKLRNNGQGNRVGKKKKGKSEQGEAGKKNARLQGYLHGGGRTKGNSFRKWGRGEGLLKKIQQTLARPLPDPPQAESKR